MNDAQLIMNKLSICHSDCDILQVFSSIHGPWAFVFWQVGVEDIQHYIMLFKSSKYAFSCASLLLKLIIVNNN